VTYKIDIVKAQALHDQGLSWREVGVALAKEQGRPVCFTADSVKNAIYRAQEEERDEGRTD
jgi:hypothetical protein